MRKLLALLVPAALFAAAAQAALVQSIDFTASYVRADKHKEWGGITLRTRFNIAEDTGAKPPELRRITFRFPKGSVANTGLFKRCSAETLLAKGPRGCPAGSKIGSGTSRADARPVVETPISARLRIFNGERAHGNPTILIHAIPELSGPLVVRGELKPQRSGPYAYILDFEVPPVPTLPGQPDASVLSTDVTTTGTPVTRNGRKRYFIEGPVFCNGTFFLLEGSFGFADGTESTVYERFTLRGGPRCPRRPAVT
jgi:hypothetical protein